MSWVALANNQTISFNNLQNAVTNGYFVALTTIPTSLEQITKSDASTYVNIDTSYAPYAAKASNQLVVKSNLRPISYSYTIYYEEACFYDGFNIEGGAANATAACANPLTITLYSPVSSFANGMKLFYDSACTNLWYGDTGGCGQYYKVIVSSISYSFTYANQSSTVGNLTACSGAVCQQIFLYPANANPCDHLGSFTLFDTDNALFPTVLYVSGGCGTTPVVGGNLWYSQGAGSDSYQVDNSGNIISTFSC
jgi:hypothetical protein